MHAARAHVLAFRPRGKRVNCPGESIEERLDDSQSWNSITRRNCTTGLAFWGRTELVAPAGGYSPIGAVGTMTQEI
jgi:hypothetical protein